MEAIAVTRYYVEGRLAGMFEDDAKRRHIWFEAAGTFRRLEGVQVFLDKNRTRVCVEGPELAATSAGINPRK